MKTITRLIATLFLIFFTAAWVDAQWSNDPASNTVVCSAEKDQREPFIITDGAGGAIIAWRDYRYTTSIFGGEIFAQRLDGEGNAQWADDGIGVNAGSLGKGHFRPVMTYDGKGGGIIGWGRSPLSFYNYDIFAQRVNTSGERTWPANDVTVSDRVGTESFHQLTSDGAHGAILTWMSLPGTPGSTDLYAQRVDSLGNTKWTENGVEICMAAESQSDPRLTGDGSGGAIITWADSRDAMGESDIYAQRIDADGTVLWTTDGVEVSNYLYFQGFPEITPDGEGGAIIVWEDSRAGNTDIWAQRINGDGESLWTSHGIPICNSAGTQSGAEIVTDGAGGAIITWQDERNGNMDIYAQRVNGAGEVQWVSNGLPVSIIANNQASPVAISDNAGGIIITWWDYRSDPLGDIYVQRLDGAGNPLWEFNGAAVCNATGYQEAPMLASDGDGGAIVAWSDRRNGSNYDIYAQNIDKNGYLGIIPDEDHDGIPDSEEQGPDASNPSYDGNTDGTPDSQQANVASFKTFDNQQYITLSVPDSVLLEKVKAIDNPDPDAPGAPSGESYPYGFFSFSITGLTAGSHTMATMILHNGPAVSQYYKYGPTPAESAHWYEFTYDGETGALFNADTVFLYLKDGIRGDYDITANGTIMEPGGPVAIASSVNSYLLPGFGINRNWPNPFRNLTTIEFSVQYQCDIVIEVFDISGRMVKQLFSNRVGEGSYQTTWDATGFNEGIYILKMTDGKQSITRKIVKVE